MGMHISECTSGRCVGPLPHAALLLWAICERREDQEP